ncbi:hypothetical protein GOP47_0014617 [Adiantum capillus-veneris]|uniref:RHOMBOID-like protein n=1 Tax=Adiantum capillus-veneris TaxID=13818 RepID=A0A9D4UMD3_ADICA|nr:hypothetical protein GOP47_0014617 [Adiantum capillus-veneris]
MGEEDLERRGSMRRRSSSSSKGVHPVHDSGAPVYLPVSQGRRWIPLLIPTIVVANIVMFIITMYVNNCPANTANDQCLAKFLKRFSFQPFSENPLIGPSTRALQQVGALDTNKVVHDHQGWRLVSCMWLHAGVIHLVANMLSLLVIGIKLEQEFGFLKIGLIYLLSGLGGSLLSSLFLQNRISVGASGALFGLLGAMLSELITNWSIYESKCGALFTLIVVVAVNLAVGILPHVDNFAHIGGFIVGFLAGFVLLLLPQREYVNLATAAPGQLVQRKRHKPYQCVLLVIALILLIAGMSVTMVLVLRGVDGNDKCSWCHYLSCVPTSRWNCDDAGVASCTTVQTGDTLQVTCVSNNQTTLTAANQSNSVLESLCAQLCN